MCETDRVVYTNFRRKADDENTKFIGKTGKKIEFGILSFVILLAINLGMLIGCTAVDATILEAQK